MGAIVFLEVLLPFCSYTINNMLNQNLTVTCNQVNVGESQKLLLRESDKKTEPFNYRKVSMNMEIDTSHKW